MLVFMLNNFKSMGMKYVNDDSFVTLIGSVGFVM